jgi:L-fucose isomerase-like protein
MTAPRLKIGLVFIGRRRPGFDMDWGRRMEERARATLGRSAFQVFEPAEKSVDEGSFRGALEACGREGVDAVVVVQATMGDGRLAPTLAQLWPDPPVLWATPESPEGAMISSCSLVGVHCWASTLRQMGHAFELAYGDPDEPAAQTQLTEAIRAAAAVRRLRRVRLGAIGGQAPGYFAMGGDMFSVFRGTGAQMQSFSLLQYADAVRQLPDAAVAEDVGRVKALGFPLKDVTEDDLPMASRHYLALRGFMEAERLDALVVREWPEMPETFGQWPYLAVARLVSEGRAVAIEGDADGALTAWLGETLGLGRCYLTDWLEHDRETITIWHGGAAPFELCRPAGQPGGPVITRHFNIKKPAVVEATIREDLPATLVRFWRCDGAYLATAREGRTVKPRRHLLMTNGLVRLDRQDPGLWFDDLCHAGMPHHVGLFAGHHEALFRRIARSLGCRYL